MKPTLIVAVLLLALGVAEASDVFVTKDAQGRPVYTDRPDALPAQRLDVKSSNTNTVEVQQRTAAQQKQITDAAKVDADAAKKASQSKATAESLAADRAKRCQEARDNYLQLMNTHRIYEPGEGEQEGERRYLGDDEIDATREDAKKVMDEFCSEP